MLPLSNSNGAKKMPISHSFEDYANLRYYSFSQKYYADNVRAILDSMDGEDPVKTQGPPQYHPISPKKKPRTIDFSMFLGLQS